MSTRVIEPTKRCYHDIVIKFNQIGKKTRSAMKRRYQAIKSNTPEKTFLSNYKNKN